jgi:hypothetical protein
MASFLDEGSGKEDMTGPQNDRDHFVAAFGPPEEAASPLQFTEPFLQRGWLRRHQRIGAGWFLGRFCFLLGEGLERFTPCLEAWSFLLPPASERRIIGYNVHGALLVMEDETEGSIAAPVRVLDPMTVAYWADPECVYTTLLSRWLPDRQIPHFLNTSAYQEWLVTSGRFLDDDEILGIRAPLPLGGEMKPENFAPMNIIDYYRATGPVYAEAFLHSGD